MMSRSALPRFGDPHAKSMDMSRWSLPLLALIVVGGLIYLPILLASGIQDGNWNVIVFSLLLEVMLILMVLGTYGSLLVLWVPALLAAHSLRRTFRSALVLVVYLPPVAGQALEVAWPHRAQSLPSRVVVVVDGEGVSVWRAGRHPTSIFMLPWDEVDRVEVAEYVHEWLAVAGLAVVAPGGLVAFPSLVLRPSYTVVRPVHGRELLAVAADAVFRMREAKAG